MMAQGGIAKVSRKSKDGEAKQSALNPGLHARDGTLGPLTEHLVKNNARPDEK